MSLSISELSAHRLDANRTWTVTLTSIPDLPTFKQRQVVAMSSNREVLARECLNAQFLASPMG